MAHATTTPKSGNPTTSAPAGKTAPDIAGLKAVIESIDGLSQNGFTNIATLARLSLASLEHPSHAKDPESFAAVFRMIWFYADDTQNSINAEAGDVGCNYTDLDMARRRAARREQSSKGAANV